MRSVEQRSEAGTFGGPNTLAESGEAVVAAALVIQRWVGPFIGLLEQALVDHALDGPVEGAGAHRDRPAGEIVDVAHDGVAVLLATSEGHDDVHGRRRQGQVAVHVIRIRLPFHHAVTLSTIDLLGQESIDGCSVSGEAESQALRNPGKEATQAIKQAKEEVGLRLGLLASITRLARFVSVTVLCATQYPLAQVVPSELRSNLTGRIAGRVTGREQVEVALGHGLADVVSPDSIAVSEKGVAYVLGVPGYELPVRCRADLVTDDAITARAAATAHLNHHPSEVFPDGT